MYINKAMVLGNLTRDPELKALPSGMKVATFSIATNSTWKDSQGEKKESVEYHSVTVFGKAAELIAQYSKKGSSLYVEGRIQTRSWEGQDGKKNYRTEIITDTFQFGPKTSSGNPTTAIDNETREEIKPEPQKGFNLNDEPIDWPDTPVSTTPSFDDF